MSRETPRRLAAENVTLRLRALDTEGAPVHVVDVSVAYDIRDRRAVEVAFVTRGKVGHGLDLMLQDLGLQLSRALQGRDPATGDPSPTSALNLSDVAYILRQPQVTVALRDPESLRDPQSLAELIEASKRVVAAMTPEQREEMYERQRESFVRAEAPWGTGMTRQEVLDRLLVLDEAIANTSEWGSALSEMDEERRGLKSALRRLETVR